MPFLQDSYEICYSNELKMNYLKNVKSENTSVDYLNVLKNIEVIYV